MFWAILYMLCEPLLNLEARISNVNDVLFLLSTADRIQKTTYLFTDIHAGLWINLLNLFVGKQLSWAFVVFGMSNKWWRSIMGGQRGRGKILLRQKSEEMHKKLAKNWLFLPFLCWNLQILSNFNTFVIIFCGGKIIFWEKIPPCPSCHHYE